MHPYGVAVSDSSGQIYVSDIALNTVHVFDSSGSFLFTFDGTSGGGTQFQYPFGIAVSNSSDQIYVSDTSLDTVQVYWNDHN